MTEQQFDREYLDAIQAAPERSDREYRALVKYMQGSTAIHHGEYVRTCLMPKIFTESTFARFAADIRVLYGIFRKVMDAYFADPSYRALFGFDARTEELILRSHHAESMLPMARIDFFYNEETGDYKFCEFNTDGSSAMNEDRELHNAQRLSTVYREFTAAHSTRTCELFDSWVDAFVGVWKRVRKTDRLPRVAIVDYMECGTVNEFEIFREHFEKKGLQAEVCDVRELQYKDGRLLGKSGLPVDAIYRRAVTSDILDHYDQSSALLDAVRDDAVLLVGDFHTQLVHNKTIFRVLQHPATLALLTPEEQAYVHAHVPVTMSFAEADPEQVIREKDAWILKPLDSYGSRGVYAGVEYDAEGWRQAVESITDREGYLLQEFYMPYVTENYGLVGDSFQKARYYNLTGVYVYDGTAQGVYSRVSLTPIISSQYSEKTLPTLIVKA